MHTLGGGLVSSCVVTWAYGWSLGSLSLCHMGRDVRKLGGGARRRAAGWGDWGVTGVLGGGGRGWESGCCYRRRMFVKNNNV